MNAKSDTEEHPPQVDLQRVLVSLDEEQCKLERVIAELRIVDIDDVPEEHDAGDVVWTSEDAGNVASDTLAREVGFGLIEEFQSALDEIRLARQRLLHGRYGTCDGCGAGIDWARLDAVPATRWCLSCAAGLERQAQRRRLTTA